MTTEAADSRVALPAGVKGRKRRWAGLLSVAISATLLVLLYRSLDVAAVGRTLGAADTLWVAISILVILPITLLRALRFYWIAPPGAVPGVAEAFRLMLVSGALNVFIPAKAGDLSKSYFVARRSDTPAGVAIGMVVYERLCDVLGIVIWCVLGWALARPQVEALPPAFWGLLAIVGAVCALLVSSERLASLVPVLVGAVVRGGRLRKLRDLAAGWPDLLQTLRGRRRGIVGFSVLLWLVHLFQIWLFTVALRVPVPFAVCASLAAVALMAGQLPLTFAGLGTRDLALVVLLAAYMPPESAAALGVLVSTRNLLPPLLGVPLMGPYLSLAMNGGRPAPPARGTPR